MAQPRSRAPLFIGLAAAGGVGYYLYSAGGSPKVAEKKFEGTSCAFIHNTAVNWVATIHLRNLKG